MTEYRYVGKSLPVDDALEKVTGKIKYVGDLEFPNILHAKLVLSKVAHGKILSIDTTEAEKIQGVVAIYHYFNTPHNYYNSHIWMEGVSAIEDELMFPNKSRHYGDKIAVVVAETKDAAERASYLIKVEYEELPAILDPEDALNKDSVRIHEERDNYLHHKVFKNGDVESEFPNAFMIVESEVTTPKVQHCCMETHTCVSDIDPFDNITVFAHCQVIFHMQLTVAKALGIPLSKVRIVRKAIGGSFGGKTHPILEPICAYISLMQKRPVKLVTNREETFLATRTRNKFVGKVKTAVAKDGKIIARKINCLVDIGAYHTNGEAVTVASTKKSFRLYKIPNQEYTSETVYTNTQIGGACRGYGSPQIHTITEVNIDQVAKKLKMDPLEFRLKNFVTADLVSKDPLGGDPVGNAQIIKCAEEGARAFGWEEKSKRSKDSGRFVRGIGMGCVAHGNGYYTNYPEVFSIHSRIDPDGVLTVKGAYHDLGCGTITIIKQIAAEVLDIDIEKVTIPELDTSVTPFDSGGTQATRVTYYCGRATEKCATELKEKMVDYFYKEFGCVREDIVLNDGYIENKNNGKERLSYGELASLVQTKYASELSIFGTYQPDANPASYGAHFAEVEVDTYTGFVKILDYVAVHDVGQSINHGLVVGQVQGAVQMGIGMALTEEYIYDSKGRTNSASFSRYQMMNAPDMPNVRVLTVEEYEPFGPFGAKGVGEAAASPVAAAVINAINNALDIELNVLPATPERIMNEINKK